MIYKFLGILLVLFFSLEINVSAQSISDIKKQKAKTEKEIAYLNSLLKEAEKNKSVSTQMSSVLKNWKRTRSRCSIFMRNWCMVAGKNGIKQIN